MDVKVDFIPPALINFVSRQLIGSGFKLFKKEVASVSKGDERFTAALKDSLYTNIREALYSEPENLEENKTEEALEENDAEEVIPKPEYISEIEEVLVEETYLNLPSNENVDQSNEITTCENDVVLRTEIEQVDSETTQAPEPRKIVFISPQVEQALSTLEKAISFIRNYSIYYPQSEITNPASNHVEEESMSPEVEKIIRENENTYRLSKMEASSRDVGSNSHPRETNQRKIIPTTQDEEEISNSSKTVLTDLVTDQIILEKITDSYTVEKSLDGDVMGKIKHKKKRYKFCGFRISFLER